MAEQGIGPDHRSGHGRQVEVEQAARSRASTCSTPRSARRSTLRRAREIVARALLVERAAQLREAAHSAITVDVAAAGGAPSPWLPERRARLPRRWAADVAAVCELQHLVCAAGSWLRCRAERSLGKKPFLVGEVLVDGQLLERRRASQICVHARAPVCPSQDALVAAWRIAKALPREEACPRRLTGLIEGWALAGRSF